MTLSDFRNLNGLLRGSNCSPQSRTPLSCIESALLLVDQRLLASLHNLLTLGQDHLNVAGIAHVGVDPTMGSVRSTSLFWCLVDLYVLNNQVAGVKTLDVSVGFGVLEE